MSENELTYALFVRIALGLGLVYGLFFVRPRINRQRVSGGKALLVRLIVALYLLIIIGYYGFFLRWFQNELFGSERTLCLQLA